MKNNIVYLKSICIFVQEITTKKIEIMTTVIHTIETNEAIVTIENRQRFYEMTIELKNGFICLGYPVIWNRLKDAKEFIKNNYNN